MYFTRRLAKRLKTNQDLFDHEGLKGYLDADDYLDAVYGHDDYDEEANDWIYREGKEWAVTMDGMRTNMNFDVEKIKALHPALFWGFGRYDYGTACWAEIADREKVTWVYNEIMKNPNVIVNLA